MANVQSRLVIKPEIFNHYAKIIQSIYLIHQIICEIHLIFESYDLEGFCQYPPNNY